MRTIVSSSCLVIHEADILPPPQCATNKSRAQLVNSDREWEQRAVAELDSALNKWTDSLPSYCKLRVSTCPPGFSVAHRCCLNTNCYGSALESRRGERAAPDSSSDTQSQLLSLPSCRPQVVHAVLWESGIASVVPIHNHLYERGPVIYPGARHLVQAVGNSSS